MKHDTQISIRLPSELLDRIREMAAAEDRSVNAIIRRMIESCVGSPPTSDG